MQSQLTAETENQSSTVPTFDLDVKQQAQSTATETPVLYETELDALRTELANRLRYNSAYDDAALLAYWCLVVPISLIMLLVTVFGGELWVGGLGALFLAIGKKFYTLAEALDIARASWQLNYLDRTKVGFLVELLHDRDKRIAHLAEMVLTAVLPHLKPEEAKSLDADQRRMLCTRLTMENAHKHMPLLVATLKSLEVMGDADALPYVEQLAHATAKSRNQEWVREAALICLPLLRRRIYEAKRNAPAVVQTVAQAVVATAANEIAEEPKTEAQLRAEARVQSLLKTLEEERKKHQKPGMRQFFNRLAWVTVFPGALYLTSERVTTQNWASAGIWALMAVISTQLHRFTLSPKQIDLAQKLAQSRDVQAIGPLAEMLEWPEPESRHIAEMALVGVLPFVRANDTTILTNKQRAALYRMLKPTETRKHWQLQMALLQALEQIGDDAAVPYVTELANMTPRFSVQKTVRDRAEACLPFLNEKAAQSRYSQTLLRGSAEPAAAPETLLRPANESQETRPEELLRPGSVSP